MASISEVGKRWWYKLGRVVAELVWGKMERSGGGTTSGC